MRHVFALIPFAPDVNGEDIKCMLAIDAWLAKYSALVQDGVRLIQDQHDSGRWYVYVSATTKEQLISQAAPRLVLQEAQARSEIELRRRLEIGMAAPVLRR